MTSSRQKNLHHGREKNKKKKKKVLENSNLFSTPEESTSIYNKLKYNIKYIINKQDSDLINEEKLFLKKLLSSNKIYNLDKSDYNLEIKNKVKTKIKTKNININKNGISHFNNLLNHKSSKTLLLKAEANQLSYGNDNIDLSELSNCSNVKDTDKKKVENSKSNVLSRSTSALNKKNFAESLARDENTKKSFDKLSQLSDFEYQAKSSVNNKNKRKADEDLLEERIRNYMKADPLYQDKNLTKANRRAILKIFEDKDKAEQLKIEQERDRAPLIFCESMPNLNSPVEKSRVNLTISSSTLNGGPSSCSPAFVQMNQSTPVLSSITFQATKNPEEVKFEKISKQKELKSKTDRINGVILEVSTKQANEISNLKLCNKKKLEELTANLRSNGTEESELQKNLNQEIKVHENILNNLISTQKAILEPLQNEQMNLNEELKEIESDINKINYVNNLSDDFDMQLLSNSKIDSLINSFTAPEKDIPKQNNSSDISFLINNDSSRSKQSETLDITDDVFNISNNLNVGIENTSTTDKTHESTCLTNSSSNTIINTSKTQNTKNSDDKQIRTNVQQFKSNPQPRQTVQDENKDPKFNQIFNLEQDKINDTKNNNQQQQLQKIFQFTANSNNTINTHAQKTNNLTWPTPVLASQNGTTNTNSISTSNNFTASFDDPTAWSNYITMRNKNIDSLIERRMVELKKPFEQSDKSILPERDSEEWYDFRYHARESFDVYIYGNGLIDYKDDMVKRHKEISRSTGIPYENIRTSIQKRDHENNVFYFKLGLKTLNDFVKALYPWHPKAFKYGIKCTRAAIDFLKPMILEVDRNKSLKSTEGIAAVKNLEKYYSIENVNRIQYKDPKNTKLPDVITNKLNCNFSKLSLLSKGLKNGIQFDLTNSTHQISFGLLRLLHLCIKCGSKDCNEKICKELSCFKCLEDGHTVLQCSSKVKCRNCNGPHLCTSDLCPVLLDWSINSKQNYFIIDFLLGEGIITHPLQAFKTRLSEEDFDNHESGREDEKAEDNFKIAQQVLQIINPKLDDQQAQLRHLVETTKTNTAQIISNTARITKCEDDITDLKSMKQMMFEIHNKIVNSTEHPKH